MIQRIAAQRRHLSTSSSSQSFLLFSYGDFFQPDNVRWGGLRFFNDDLMYPGRSLPLHAHDEMEVVTIVVAGELRQRDGTRSVVRLHAGDVQVLSAGTGVRHVEMNESSIPTHFYQLGVFPRQTGTVPSCFQTPFGALPQPGVLLPVASGQGKGGAVPLHADATVYIGSLDPYRMLDYPTGANRRVFLYLTRGMLAINGITFEAGDQARIDEESGFMIGSIDRSEYILVDIPALT